VPSACWSVPPTRSIACRRAADVAVEAAALLVEVVARVEVEVVLVDALVEVVALVKVDAVLVDALVEVVVLAPQPRFVRWQHQAFFGSDHPTRSDSQCS